MVHKDFIERRKAQQRKKEKATHEIMDSDRCNPSDEAGAIAETPPAEIRVYRRKGASSPTITTLEYERPFIEENKEPNSGKVKSKESYRKMTKRDIAEIMSGVDQLINQEDRKVLKKNALEEVIHYENGVFPHPEKEKNTDKEPELIERIDFKSGSNTLSIKYFKKHNRMFSIKVFLNDSCEIRPVTYTGSSTGNAFWSLLKGVLKK